MTHVGHDAAAIAAAIAAQIDHGPYDAVELFGDGQAGLRIAEILASAEISIQKRLAY